MRLLLALGTCLLLAGITRAQNTESSIATVTFHTSPPGAKVYADTSGTRKYEKFLGLSGEPLHLDLSSLRGRTNMQLVFKLEGYHDRQETVGNYYFSDKDRYPEQGSLPLEPLNAMVPVRHFASTHPGLMVALGIGALGTTLLGLGRWRRMKSRLQRAQVLEDFEARSDTVDPRIMSLLGGYRILEKLGTGGMATVYKAVPDGTLEEDQAVAVKIIRPDITGDDLRTRFEREIRVCSALRHPAIVEVLDFGDQDGLLYLVMELVSGRNLVDLVPAEGMQVDQALECLEQVFSGVEAAHRQGIMHRDLKPENVMLRPDGRAKIMDFGLARGLDSPALTKTGHALGTPTYMAPEQVLGRKPTLAVDQYALGCLVCHLLTGRPPFEDTEEVSVVIRKMNEPPPSLRQRRSELPEAVDAVVARMLARDPGERYPTVAEAWEALRGVFGQGTGVPAAL